jgi:hypothetical protein
MADRLNARERRFRKFVENHELFHVTSFDPKDFWETIEKRGLPRDWWRRIDIDFKAAEFKFRVALSNKRREAGRKGAKIAGRGRAKKTA